jgi:hypothetical protein
MRSRLPGEQMAANSLQSIAIGLLAVWCAAATPSPLFAQAAAGEITGILKDQGGAAVPAPEDQ